MKGKRISKIVVGISLVLVLAVALPLTSACAPAAPEVVHIRYSCWSKAPPSVYTYWQQYYWDRCAEVTEGRIEMEYFWGGTLYPARETMTSLKAGIVDAAAVCPGYHPGQIPLWDMTSLPGMPDLWAMSWASLELAKHPAMQEELAKWGCRFAAPISCSPYWVMSKKPINSLDDLKGLKIRGSGRQTDLLEVLGAVPVSMPFPEIYDSLAKGTIDGAGMAWVQADIYKIYEVAKYMFRLPLGAGLDFMVQSLDSWNKISPEDQKRMTDLIKEEFIMAHSKGYWADAIKKSRVVCVDEQGCVDAGPLSAEDAARAAAAVEPVKTAWAEAREKDGLPGKEVLELWFSAYEKYEPLSPFEDIR